MNHDLTTRTLTLPAPAKLNRFLHITGRRDDGYHLLQTYFHLLDYGDELVLQRTHTNGGLVRRVTDNPLIPEADDLVMRAAHLLRQHSQARYGVDIALQKRLPIGGGVGGGSSNAATVLLGLNQLWQCHLSLDELAGLGQQLGADVPVFVYGHSAWAEGVGEQLTALPIRDCWYLVVYPGIAVSTAEIFSSEGLTRHCQPIRIATFLAEQTNTTNVFEPVVRKQYPEIDQVFLSLSRYCKAQLTGTGACVFASFDSKETAQSVLLSLEQTRNWHCFIAKGVKQSPLTEALATQQ